MQIPVDVKAVIDEAMNIDEARTTPLSVSVYIDETAPGDSIAHVRGAFASASIHARVTLSYLTDDPLVPYSGDDMAVIVAGLSMGVGARAEELRAAGVPVMVATTMPSLVEEISRSQGHPISSDDIVAPAVSAGICPRAADVDTSEPYALEGSVTTAFDRRMGEWIIEACRDKRLAFALAFPFVCRPLSVDAVNATAMQNAGIGLVVFIPGADLPLMTLNQAKMLLQIAAAYGEPMGMERAKELAAVVGGAFAFRAVARQIVAFVPALGWAVKAAIGYTGTMAMGRAAIEYFESGGAIGGLVGVVSRARDKAVQLVGDTQACLTGEGHEAISAVSPSGPQGTIEKHRGVTSAARAATRQVRNVAHTAADAAVPLVSSVMRAGVDAVGTEASTAARNIARSVTDAARINAKGSNRSAH